MHAREKHILLFLLALSVCCCYTHAQSDTRPYLCELGLQAGCGYYAGEATPHVFQNVRETYGAHFRYKFDKRWALQVKGLTHRITGPDYDEHGQVVLDAQGQTQMWTNQMINLDVMGEFNFFRFGAKEYDKRTKRFTPYIFTGIGFSLYQNQDGQPFSEFACYFPIGVGIKWKFSKFVGLNFAWQYNIYFADNLEHSETLDNLWDINGRNIMNNDVTSQLTLGIVFEFGQAKKVCRSCTF